MAADSAVLMGASLGKEAFKVGSADQLKPFAEFWAEEIFPFIKDDYERILLLQPTREAERILAKETKKKEKEERKKA